MPTICIFYGILIQMFWNDHAPPHFHALYQISRNPVLQGGVFHIRIWEEFETPSKSFPVLQGGVHGEFEVVINICNLKVIEGKMPKRALILILEWAFEHRDDLMKNWKLCEMRKTPQKIPPLE